MLSRVFEPEVMDSPEEARDYDAMDHSAVNRAFVEDFLYAFNAGRESFSVLDVGTGTARIPIEFAKCHPTVRIVGIDLAEHMLRLGRDNVRRAALDARIRLDRVDAKAMPFADGAFDAVVSNSIVHHIPIPTDVLAEMVRVTARGGTIFVRDLLRPADSATVEQLVALHAADANAHQRQMFADSLRAALTLDDVRDIVAALHFDASTVRQTTDRHWTWIARRP